ncbi:hypothetical protein CH063_13593 [Colletotrichum higginsianum]|uniref:Uncharacterized protein n=1 Tax=Colletotrichum higginsianum (strain IMI 349063) TaxID=759273 RepID=H1VV23_COLHI|nr:hypothetical protein CH063_13593 [Colletotrichum higginsianum]
MKTGRGSGAGLVCSTVGKYSEGEVASDVAASSQDKACGYDVSVDVDVNVDVDVDVDVVVVVKFVSGWMRLGPCAGRGRDRKGTGVSGKTRQGSKGLGVARQGKARQGRCQEGTGQGRARARDRGRGPAGIVSKKAWKSQWDRHRSGTGSQPLQHVGHVLSRPGGEQAGGL